MLEEISSAGSVANWVTLHGTAGSRETIWGHLSGSTVAPPANSRPKLHHSGSDKNRSSHYKRGIWRNGDCHDVGLGVLNFTHPERCAVTCSWSYEGMTHSQTAAQDCLKRPASSTGFCMHTSAAGPVEGEAYFVVVDRSVIPVVLKVYFLQKNGLKLDFTTKPVTVHSSSKLDTVLSKILHTPLLPAAFRPAQRREAQVMAIAV